MAEPFKDFSSYFAELGQPQGTGQVYDLTGGGLATTPPAGSTQAPQSPSQPAQAPQQPRQPTAAPTPSYQAAGAPQISAPRDTTPGTQPQIQLSPSNPTSAVPPEAYQSLFAPITQQIQRGQQALGGAVSAFTQAAGPYRTFESAGAADTLRSALQPGSDLTGARELLGARYAGPSGLDPATIDDLTRSISYLQPAGASLSTVGGIEDLLQQRTPGLTAGQRRLEIQQALTDPSYRQAATDLESAIRTLFSDYGSAQEQARGIAQTRAGQEADIATRAREQLTGERGTIEAGLGGRVQSARERELALQQAYDKYTKTGTLEDLAALDPLTAADLSGFDTSTNKLSREAEAAKAAIVSDPKFAAIKDVPLLELGATRHGREALFLPKEWVKENKDKYTKRELKELQTLARRRQKALEDSGFASGSAERGITKEGRGNQDFGRFGKISNLYFGEGFTPQDTRSFVNLDPGIAGVTRESLATGEERRIFNAIQDLLGQQDRLETPELAYKAPEIASELDRYLTEEAAKTERITGGVEEGSKKWKKHISKARKARRLSEYGPNKLARQMGAGRTGISRSAVGALGGLAYRTR